NHTPSFYTDRSTLCDESQKSQSPPLMRGGLIQLALKGRVMKTPRDAQPALLPNWGCVYTSRHVGLGVRRPRGRSPTWIRLGRPCAKSRLSRLYSPRPEKVVGNPARRSRSHICLSSLSTIDSGKTRLSWSATLSHHHVCGAEPLRYSSWTTIRSRIP